MNIEDQARNYAYTVLEDLSRMRSSFADFVDLLPDFTDDEKDILWLVFNNAQGTLQKKPYAIIQSLISRGILTTTTGRGGEHLKFVGRAKSNHKERDGEF